MSKLIGNSISKLADFFASTNYAEEEDMHRLMAEQHEAILSARANGSFVIMFIGKDKRKHYKASCDLTEEELELIKKQEENHHDPE